MSTPILEMKGITKVFPGVKALDDVDVQISPGEVVVLFGENGAGKSTLMKVLAGVHEPNEGTILFKGKNVSITDTKVAEKLGISMIYQELNLVPDISVMENIFLGREIRKGHFVDFKKMDNKTREILKELDVPVDPKSLIRDLSVAHCQMIEIARALMSNARIIIMDEPTASITENETEKLFAQIDKLKAKGVAIFYISHRIQEILEISDRIVVLRDGSHVKTVISKETNPDELVRLMVGREVGDLFPKEYNSTDINMLEVKNISGPGVSSTSFNVKKGEVLGFAGLMGAGRTELMRLVMGSDKRHSGSIRIDGVDSSNRSPSESVKNGFAFVTEDRRETGIISGKDITFNITLSSINKHAKKLFIDKSSEKLATDMQVNNLNIKTPNLQADISNLSGGNQQKVIISRWLETDAKVIIMDEPTRGIDVGAKREIYNIINNLTSQGKSIILISSDLSEVLGLSDRIAVMSGGNLTGILSKEEANQVSVMKLATQNVRL